MPGSNGMASRGQHNAPRPYYGLSILPPGWALLELQPGDEGHSQLSHADRISSVGSHVEVGISQPLVRLQPCYGAIGALGPRQPNLDAWDSLTLFVLHHHCDVER